MVEIEPVERVAEWTREHVGPGGGIVVIWLDAANEWALRFQPYEGQVQGQWSAGPLTRARAQADNLVRQNGHRCKGCLPW